MPQLGESVTEGTITKWFKQVGERVELDEPLFEVSTDKVDSEVPSPMAGVVSEIRVAEGETVDVGTILAVLGDGDSAAVAAAESAPEPEAVPAPEPVAAAPAPEAPPAPAAEVPASAAPASNGSGTGGTVLSPLVRKLITENALDVTDITGTGLGGRITRDDVLAVIDSRATGAAVAAPAITSAPAPVAAVASAPAHASAPAPIARSGEGDTTVPLSNIRLRTGQHMVASLATSPHAITATEVDFEAVERARKPLRDQFRAEEGFALTYLPFVSRAVVDAIADFPFMNASVGAGELIVHHSVNLSIAVDLDFQGLLAPVVMGADGLRLRAIARDINDLATRARTKKLLPDDLAGGTFTISNSGSYGTLLVAPIINQPQAAILSTDGVKRRPVVVELPDGSESIAIHSVGNLTLSWDHRAFDGAYAAAFMQRVKDILETRDWAAEL